MASGQEESCFVKNVYSRVGNIQDAGSQLPTPFVGMAEAVAAAMVLELVLALRTMLQNVKTNVRRPGPACARRCAARHP